MFHASSLFVVLLILAAVATGLLTAAYFASRIALIRIDDGASDSKTNGGGAHARLIAHEHKRGHADEEEAENAPMSVAEIAAAIADGANAFLYAEYRWMGAFMSGFGLILLLMLGLLHDWPSAIFSTIAFISGVLTSVTCGFIGMRVAVFTNCRTAKQAERGLQKGMYEHPGNEAHLKARQAAEGFELAFDTAFRGGAVMGFALVSLGLIVLFILINAFSLYYSAAFTDKEGAAEQTKLLYESIAGYGLGGSSVALFGRVGGGIYTVRQTTKTT